MGHADTRTRIQKVALRLFNDKGYDATSLREIADEIGVTKAALYYHFKTKEDIVTSLVEDRTAVIERLMGWSRTLPHTTEGRRAFITRYAEELHVAGVMETMQFFERNPTALKDHPSAKRMRDAMISLVDSLAPPGAPLAERLRYNMAIFAMHASFFLLRDVDDEERKQAALEVALDLVN